MEKYEITSETKIIDNGVTLYRIRALRSFWEVKEGDLGGWVQRFSNLSHDGDCWVADEAMAYENAQVLMHAFVGEYARVHGHAIVGGNSQVYGASHVYGNAVVGDDAFVYGDVEVHGYARVCGNSMLSSGVCC